MSFDLIIVGAGPAGLSLACALADTSLKIALIEKSTDQDLADPPYDGREIALTHQSMQLMQQLGMWQRVEEQAISRLRHAKVLNGSSDYSLNFDYQDSGKDTLGYMMSNHLIRKSCYDALMAQKSDNIQLLTGVSVTNIRRAGSGWTVETDQGAPLSATLLVAADSRFSQTRRSLGISTDMLDFGRSCIVGKMHHEGASDQTAYECFQYDRTLAVLPLNNQEVSIVITVNSDEAESVLKQAPESLAADIQQRVKSRFGNMKLSTELYHYPLVATYASRFNAPHAALIGDAAVGMHPVTAHGFNLGLSSAVNLAAGIKKAVKQNKPVSDAAMLRAYHRSHYKASRALYLGTNAIVKLYTNQSPPAKIARKALLHLGNVLKPARKVIIDQLTQAR